MWHIKPIDRCSSHSPSSGFFGITMKIEVFRYFATVLYFIYYICDLINLENVYFCQHLYYNFICSCFVLRQLGQIFRLRLAQILIIWILYIYYRLLSCHVRPPRSILSTDVTFFFYHYDCPLFIFFLSCQRACFFFQSLHTSRWVIHLLLTCASFFFENIIYYVKFHRNIYCLSFGIFNIQFSLPMKNSHLVLHLRYSI